MENNDQIIDTGITSDENLSFTGFAKQYLLETAKWAKFLSIIGFIFIGLIVLVALFAGSMFSTIASQSQLGNNMSGGRLTIIYLLMAVLYFFPVYYLFLFASNAKRALVSNDNGLIETALEKLKSHYKFMGIFTIVILAFYCIIFIIAISVGTGF